MQEALKNVKHQMKGNATTPKHIAATAGQLLYQTKSNVSLWGLTRQLMKQAGKSVSIIRFNNPYFDLINAWSKSLHRALFPRLQTSCIIATKHSLPQYLFNSDQILKCKFNYKQTHQI